MEFNSKETRYHIIQPIAYNCVRKIRKPNAPTHSAYDQYNIHCLAYSFESDIIKIPKPCTYEKYNSYVMEQIMEGEFIQPDLYGIYPELFVALISFTQHMCSNGYWPRDFSIFRTHRAFILFGFSQFGCIDKDRVRFPKNPRIYTLEESSRLFGIHIYQECDMVSTSFIDVFDELTKA